MLRWLRGLWHGLDVLRRVLHLLLLLLLVALLFGALRSSIPRLPARGALVIHPSGELTEQLAGEPLERAINEAQGQGAPQTLLWDLTRAIRAAGKDKRIQALLIETDDLDSAGQVQLEELAAAIAEFRRSGKKVIAHGSYFQQGQYYLAAQADEVYLDPLGFVLLDGYARYRMFYKDALDKLSVDVHLIRAGKYKSADEPFVRHDMSPEDKQESLVYLQALWSGYRQSVGAARHLDPAALDAYANGYASAVQRAGGDTAEVALQAHLVTGLRTAAQVEQRLNELVGGESERGDSEHRNFSAVDLDDYLKVTRTEERLHRHAGQAVGVVIASGEILDGNQRPGTIGGDSTARLLRRAREDGDIKSVVLRVDSPGGSVLASEVIYREVQALRTAGKPVVVSMSDVAASGGYYIAAPADEIIASANTITGSIGVFATVPTFDRTLAKLGVQVDGVGTTALSGVMRLDRPLQPDMQQILQAGVEHTYSQFLGHVADGRHKSRTDIDAVAQGRVWAGSDALRLGLVDKLGTYQDAVRSAAKRGGLGTDYEVRLVEPDLSLTQQLLVNMRSTVVKLLRAVGIRGGAGVGLASAAPLQSPLQSSLLRSTVLGPVARELALWQQFGARPGAYAYCFCGID